MSTAAKRLLTFVAPMSPEIVTPITVFGLYAVALAVTAAVCYKYRAEIF